MIETKWYNCPHCGQSIQPNAGFHYQECSLERKVKFDENSSDVKIMRNGIWKEYKEINPPKGK